MSVCEGGQTPHFEQGEFQSAPDDIWRLHQALRIRRSGGGSRAWDQL